MKKLTTIIAILFAVTAFGQAGAGNHIAKSLPDSTEFISKKHIEIARQKLFQIMEPLEGKLIAAKYNGIIEGMNALYEELLTAAGEDYLRKKKPGK